MDSFCGLLCLFLDLLDLKSLNSRTAAGRSIFLSRMISISVMRANDSRICAFSFIAISSFVVVGLTLSSVLGVKTVSDCIKFFESK